MNTVINDSARCEFYKHFHDLHTFLLTENNLYHHAENHISGYSGGLWQFHYDEQKDVPWFVLDNSNEQFLLTNVDNYFSESVQQFEGSIALCSLLYNRLCWYFHAQRKQALCELFVHYHKSLNDLAESRGYKAYWRFIN